MANKALEAYVEVYYVAHEAVLQALEGPGGYLKVSERQWRARGDVEALESPNHKLGNLEALESARQIDGTVLPTPSREFSKSDSANALDRSSLGFRLCLYDDWYDLARGGLLSAG